MKIRYSFLGIFTLLFVWLCVSCNDLEKIHEKYLDEEITYLGKPDSLKAYPGAGKIKLTWYQNADPRIETTVIYWNLRQDSVVKTFTRNTISGFQKDSIIIDRALEEGSNIFELINRNSNHEKSLVSTVQGEVYGSSYTERLRIRPVTSIQMTDYNVETKAGKVSLKWGTVPSNCVGTIVRYKKYPSGEEVSIRVKSSDTGIELTQVGNRLFHPDDILYLKSLYLPAGSIDTLVSPELKEQIVTYKVSVGTLEVRDPVYGALLSSPEYLMTPDSVKYIWTTLPQANISMMDCDRFGNFATIQDFKVNLFRLMFNADHTVDVSGYGSNYISSNTGGNSWEPQRVSVYNPATRVFQMIYKRTINNGGNITIFEETLVPR